MKLKTNYHSHSVFCDGKSPMEDIVSNAIQRGFTHFGISSHAPVPYNNNFALKEENFTAYKQEFLRLKDKYKHQIKLYFGLEMDFITDIIENISQKAKNYSLEYFIGSVHQVKEHNSSQDTWFIDGHDPQIYDDGIKNLFDNDIQRAAKCFFEQQIRMIQEQRPDILGHCDKIVMHNKNRHFQENEKWYQEIVYSLLDTAINNDTIIEINTRGIYRKRHNDFYPSSIFLKYLVDKNAHLTISTDCHKAEETDACYYDALNFLKSVNCKELYYFENTWKPASINDFI